ncbi:sugar isomerase (SIS) [Beutenbergia cavernae DSM 12333]|uniref:Sugar isomerase (SIS) n=1 Tax=Beutenbergia cavernae (strain ATCC BAA-8 / DSM 12333 / CCUG 43141 / JCM 11478 / NBRC 16432 / NCIMB 13614 / HKI 0122) TaxID=471853 RepID=C5C2T7_BEUC1|nr:SIS domain-containing protein [Beutenbergia cavernae]ACQ81781.1 sugar isomerase (SIS) [Beutenbergia cavernae DSM 12333]
MSEQGPDRFTSAEIASQPELWRRASAHAGEVIGLLPAHGESVAVVGCGTSWFMAQAYASRREELGHGVTDAFTATEFPYARDYDRVVAISRSGTTTEIIDVLARLRDEAGAPSGGVTSTTLLTAVGTAPAADLADATVVLDYADESSVVQTRFATSALVLLLATLGDDVDSAATSATATLEAPVAASWTGADQVTFLGTGWTIGLAHEAGLKLREASQQWAESYSAMEYRHGPIAIAQPGRVVWVLGPVPDGLAEQVAATGAELVTSDEPPLAQLVLAQRLAVATALARGLDPDAPRHLTRSVVLDDEEQ